MGSADFLSFLCFFVAKSHLRLDVAQASVGTATRRCLDRSEHSILRVDALRYSITFRTMRED